MNVYRVLFYLFSLQDQQINCLFTIYWHFVYAAEVTFPKIYLTVLTNITFHYKHTWLS